MCQFHVREGIEGGVVKRSLLVFHYFLVLEPCALLVVAQKIPEETMGSFQFPVVQEESKWKHRSTSQGRQPAHQWRDINVRQFERCVVRENLIPGDFRHSATDSHSRAVEEDNAVVGRIVHKLERLYKMWQSSSNTYNAVHHIGIDFGQILCYFLTIFDLLDIARWLS